MAGTAAQYAAQYQGAGYEFGGAPAGGIGHWDCSSFANWVIGHDMKQAIPGYAAGTYTGKSHGPVVMDWATWTGCTTISGPPSQGDLCIWAGVGASGHMGIAVDGGHMISALNHRYGTLFSPISGYGPHGIPVMYRRLNGTPGAGVSLPTGAATGCAQALGIPVGLIAVVTSYAVRNRFSKRRL